MTKTSALVCLSIVFGTAIGFAEERTWTDTSGRSMKAEFVRLEDTDVVFRKDGKEVTVPISRLAPQDRDAVVALSEQGGTDSPFEEAADDKDSPATSPDAAEKPKGIEQRMWTDAQGKQVKAKFVRMNGQSVVLSRSGRISNVPFYNLSQPDQDYVAELLKERGEEDKIPPPPTRGNQGNTASGVSGAPLSGPSGGPPGVPGASGPFPGAGPAGMPGLAPGGRLPGGVPGGGFPGSGVRGGGFPGSMPSLPALPTLPSGPPGGFAGGFPGSTPPGGAGFPGGSPPGGFPGGGSPFPGASPTPGPGGSGFPGSTPPGGGFPGGPSSSPFPGSASPDPSAMTGGPSPSMGPGSSFPGSSSSAFPGAPGGPPGGSSMMGGSPAGMGGLPGMSGMGGPLGMGGPPPAPELPRFESVYECSHCKKEFSESESKGKTHCPSCGVAWINQGGTAGTFDKSAPEYKSRWNALGTARGGVGVVKLVIAAVALLGSLFGGGAAAFSRWRKD